MGIDVLMSWCAGRAGWMGHVALRMEGDVRAGLNCIG